MADVVDMDQQVVDESQQVMHSEHHEQHETSDLTDEDFLSEEDIMVVSSALQLRSAEELAKCVMSIESVYNVVKDLVIKSGDNNTRAKSMQPIKDQVVVMNMGEKQVELTDMITKDGKLKKKKTKRQMSPEEIKEKLRKLRESRDDIPMKTCETCGYRTREPYKMRRHERTHTGEKPFKCPLCPFRGAEKSVVVKHLKSNVHSKKSGGAQLKVGATSGMGLRIDCDQCTFTATTSQQMIKHKQNRHEGLQRKVGKLRCPFCDYRNSYQKVMDLHIKAHEDEGTSKPIIAKTTETPADADGIVTVYLDDLVSWNNPPAEDLHQQEVVIHAPPTQSNDAVVQSNDDGVDELLTSING